MSITFAGRSARLPRGGRVEPRVAGRCASCRRAPECERSQLRGHWRTTACGTSFRRPTLEMQPSVLPRLTVDAGCCVPLHGEVGRTQLLHVIHVMQKRREPLFPVSLGCLTYPLERAGRGCSALRPNRVTLGRVPLGPLPSLPPLRRPLASNPPYVRPDRGTKFKVRPVGFTRELGDFLDRR
jgi:hypothetical protein